MDTLSILQYNTRKSRNIVMIPLFQNDNILDIDIITLQEPWRNTRDQTTYHPRKESFHLLYPKNNKARVCFFVNKKID